MPNFQLLQFASGVAGLAQADDVSFSLSVSSFSLGSGAQSVFTATGTMNTSAAIPDVQAQLTGLNSKWFWLVPLATYYYPDGTNASTADLYFTMRTFFSGRTVTVKLTILNNDFSSFTVPAFTLSCRAYVDAVPF